jgi:hypothetical protein
MKLDPAAAPESQAVFIGRALDTHRPRLEAALAACESDEERNADHG